MIGSAEFLLSYPEFSKAETLAPGLIDAKISEASTLTASEIFGDKYAIGVMLRTADMLARSPFARDMRLLSKDGSTAYSVMLRELVRSVAGGYRVA